MCCGASYNRLLSAGGGNFRCPIPGPASAAPQDDALAEFEDDLSRTIVDCEVNSSAWTLMHRYNKATELIDSVLNVSASAVTWPSTLTCLHDLYQTAWSCCLKMSVADTLRLTAHNLLPCLDHAYV